MRISVGVFAAMLTLGATVAHADHAFPYLDSNVVAVKSVTATSTLPDKKNEYAAERALDYVTKQNDMHGPITYWSAWCEGKKDEGIGEKVTITLAEPTQIDEIKVGAGVWRTAALHTANNVITAMNVTVDGKTTAIKPAGRKFVTVKAGGKISTIVLEVTAAKKGRMNDSCIAAVDLMRGGERLVPMIGLDPKALAVLPAQLKEIQAAIGAPGMKGLDKLIAFPFTSLDADGFFDSGSKQATAKNWAEIQAACKAYKIAQDKAEKDGTMYVDPLACPTAAPHDETDDRPSRLRSGGPKTITVLWQSHREIGVTWDLVYTDRWRLSDIGYE